MSRRPVSRPRRALVVAALLVAGPALMVAGCGAGPVERPPEPTANPTAATSSVPVPADGRTLTALGFRNGPDSFSVPRTSLVTVASDQPSLVTVVFGSPDAATVYAYLARTLPDGGFRITGQQADPTTPALAFTGRGWNGNFTGNGPTSALTLRPAG